MNSEQQTFDFMQRPLTAVQGTVEPFVRPWMDTSKSFNWRRGQLQREAEQVGAACIVYKRGEYGRSLLVARAQRDAFYQQHESELWPNAEDDRT